MISEIVHCSEAESFKLLSEFPPEVIAETFLISISESPGVHKRHMSALWANVLCLDFADTDDCKNPKAFDPDFHAAAIYKFVEYIHNLPRKHTLVIHCYMGVYRSNAVAHAIADYYGLYRGTPRILVQNRIGLRQPVKQNFVYARCHNGLIETGEDIE